MSESFDTEVKIGEIRVFADAKEPLVAAVVEARGLAGWRIVPVSPYGVPVNGSELQVGERVFQLWNACTASRKFVSRSWIVDRLASSDLAHLTASSDLARQAVPSASSRTALHGLRLGDYERRALTVGGDFAGWQAKFPAKKRLWTWPTASWAAAAVILISLGTFYLLPQFDTREEPVCKCVAERALSVQMVREEKVAPLERDNEPPPAPEAMEAADVDVRVDGLEIAAAEPAPRVTQPVKAEKMKAAPSVRMKKMRADAVVARRAKPAASEVSAARAERKSLVKAGTEPPFDERVTRSLAELKAMQNPDGSWGQKPLKNTALAVLAMMAHGETADSKEYGPALTAGVKYLTEAKLEGCSRQDVQAVACALCCATTAVRNPNIRTAAENALASIGDKRSVEAGRDWSGLLVDLTRTDVKPSASRVAAAAPEKDKVAETSLLVLQLLSVSEAF